MANKVKLVDTINAINAFKISPDDLVKKMGNERQTAFIGKLDHWIAEQEPALFLKACDYLILAESPESVWIGEKNGEHEETFFWVYQFVDVEITVKDQA